jgi:hypothetical protein
VIAGEQGEEGSLDGLAALGELGGEILSELLKLLNGCGHEELPGGGGKRAARKSGRRARRREQ